MGRPAFPAVVFKSAELEPAGGDASPDLYEFVASDESVDRAGDIVRVDGWRLAEYRRNPIVLFAHDSKQPVGIAEKVWKSDSRLMARIKLAAAGTSAFVDSVRSLVAQKILRAVSVGFRPTKEPKLREESGRVVGFEFVGQDLMEISLVAVGANTNALAVAKSMNLDAELTRRLFATSVPGSELRRKVARAYIASQRLRVCNRQA